MTAQISNGPATVANPPKKGESMAADATCDRPARRRGPRRLRGTPRDSGDTNLQMMILFPVVLVVFLTIVEVCNVYFAKQAAVTAAREGVAYGRGYGSSSSAGAARAEDVLQRLDGTLNAAHVSTAGSSATRMEITITGRAPSVLGYDWPIHVRAVGTVEQWTNP